MVACQSTSTERSATDSAASPAPPAPIPALPPNEQPDDVWERVRLDLSWHDIDHARVDKARETLLRQHNYVPAPQDRANYYLHHIVEEVDKRGMPMEIALLPMIESTLNPFAASRSGAAGLWQIMPTTGTHLGLAQDSWYDGRQAVRDSTTGALNYLEQLHKKFDNDWLLALAAYNCGGANVRRAQRSNKAKGLDTDYWSLDLPTETHNYVPKLLALTQIVADPQKFNVTIPENFKQFPAQKTVIFFKSVFKTRFSLAAEGGQKILVYGMIHDPPTGFGHQVQENKEASKIPNLPYFGHFWVTWTHVFPVKSTICVVLTDMFSKQFCLQKILHNFGIFVFRQSKGFVSLVWF